MLKEIFALCLILLFGILYLYTYFKVQKRFFDNIWETKNIATLLLFIASNISGGLNLLQISDMSGNMIQFFSKSDIYLKTIGYLFLFFLGMWCWSFLLFRLSFYFVGFLTKEDETEQIKNNNLEISLIHSFVLLFITLLSSKYIVKIASTFIPYPEFPF